jgi:hypothetical protein
MMWKAGTQPDQIVDEDGKHVGFTDAGWASQIIKAHNEVVKSIVSATEASVSSSPARYTELHKNNK